MSLDGSPTKSRSRLATLRLFSINDDAVSCGRARQWDSTDANGDREAMHDGRK